MMRGWQRSSLHCVPIRHANEAAPLAMSWPVACELMPPSEQNLSNAQALVVSHAEMGGKGGGGECGFDGGGCGNGATGFVLKDSAVTELIVPGPQSVLRAGKKRVSYGTRGSVVGGTHLSVKNPQTCAIWSGAIVTNTDGTSAVDGRPSWQNPSFANWQLSSPSNSLMTEVTCWRGPHCSHCRREKGAQVCVLRNEASRIDRW